MTIVEKIKALMAKAASTDNQHEAEAFLAKAYELMERHQLEASDLETDDPVDGEKVYEKGSTKAAPDWDFMLVFATARYFGCKAIRIAGRNGKWHLDLVGRQSARITTMEMHKYLVATVRRLGREAVGSEDFRVFEKDEWGDTVWMGRYMNADQCARRIGNALRTRLTTLASQHDTAVPSTASGKNALVTTNRVLAVYNERHPDSMSIGGTFFSNAGARKLADGIGLNLQTGTSAGQRLLK